MSLDSTVGIAKVGTKSLRATVPEGIVVFLDLKAGDKLEWKMEVQDSERIVIVKKSIHINKEADEIARKYSQVKKSRK